MVSVPSSTASVQVGLGKPDSSASGSTTSFALPWLRFAVAMVFLGRAWQHLTLDAPHWAFFWSQNLSEGWVTALFGMEWQVWATSPQVERGILSIIRLQGVFYALCGVLAALPAPRAKRLLRLWSAGLVLGAAQLLLLAVFYWLDHMRQFGQFIEYGLQVASPVALVLAVRRDGFGPAAEWLLRGAIALTFTGHGLYAFGYYEVPGAFLTMAMEGMAVDQSTATHLLKAAGLLDFMISALVLLGGRVPRIDRTVLAYACFWGLMTAAARVWTFVDAPFWFSSLAQWGHESALRLIHGLGPLFLLLSTGDRQASVNESPIASPHMAAQPGGAQ